MGDVVRVSPFLEQCHPSLGFCLTLHDLIQILHKTSHHVGSKQVAQKRHENPECALERIAGLDRRARTCQQRDPDLERNQVLILEGERDLGSK